MKFLKMFKISDLSLIIDFIIDKISDIDKKKFIFLNRYDSDIL